MGSHRFSVFFDPRLTWIAFPLGEAAPEKTVYLPVQTSAFPKGQARDYAALVQEYFRLAVADSLSENQAERMSRLLAIACEDATFSILVNELDEMLLQSDRYQYSKRQEHIDNQIAIVKEFVLSDDPIEKSSQRPLWDIEDGNHTQRLLNFLHQSALHRLPGMTTANTVKLKARAKRFDQPLSSAPALQTYPKELDSNRPDSRDDLRAASFNIHRDRLKELRLQIQQPKQIVDSHCLGQGEKVMMRLAAIAGFIAACSFAGVSSLSWQNTESYARQSNRGMAIAQPHSREEARFVPKEDFDTIHETSTKPLDDVSIHKKIEKWRATQQDAEARQLEAENHQIYAEKKANQFEAERWYRISQNALASSETAIRHINYFGAQLEKR